MFKTLSFPSANETDPAVKMAAERRGYLMNMNRLRIALIPLLTLGVLAFSAKPALAQQASITLRNSSAELCHQNNTEWTLSKTLTSNVETEGVHHLIWGVTATRGLTTDNFITVNGVVTVTNTGSANATIGNIVINLQKPNSPKQGSNASHVSVSANVANAVSGDAATSANIVAAGSQENAATNAAWGTNNYTVSGARGTFIENAGSGELEFTDASNNTVWAITPQQVLTPGQSVTLLYTATFNNTVLGLAAGQPIKVEALVTFGNSGARGGSGASAANIDISGDGVIDNTLVLQPGEQGANDADEARIRTVPSRVTRTVPALEWCNNEVTLHDTSHDIDILITGGDGSLTLSNFLTDIGGGIGIEVVSASASRTVEVDVTCVPPVSGIVTNYAYLDGASSSVWVQGPQIGIDPITGLPIYQYFDFPCCVGVDLSASAFAVVACEVVPPVVFVDGDYCTYSQGGFGGNGAPYDLLVANFPVGGIEVGIPGPGGRSMKFTVADAIGGKTKSPFLPNYLPENGAAGALTADVTNPTSTSSGKFGSQLLALKINLMLSDLVATPAGFGDLYYCNPGDSLNNTTVRNIVALMEIAIGGGGLPSWQTFDSLHALAEKLNAHSFHECIVGTWATTYLSRTPCP